ncbi:MAG: hypothetical protein KA521_09175 [Crocinitomicaceae bacterium]|nr:hypothetical protein [Crocinitomicaceae bacterium]
MKPLLIEKELIYNLSFIEDKTTVSQHPNLKQQIVNATLLGNNEHKKVSIIFQDDESVKQVETTIWASGEKFICLKGGSWIPIHRILEIIC